MTQLFMVHPGPLPATEPDERLRAATHQDAAELARLMQAAYDQPWDAARIAHDLLDAPDVPVTWVLVEDGAILACASERLLPGTYPGAGYLHYVAADASASGRGLGAIVTRRVLAGFAARGLDRAVLETDDFRRPAVMVYLRLGFVPEYRDETERATWSTLLPQLLTTRPTKGS
jgi:mycothiol synthase